MNKQLNELKEWLRELRNTYFAGNITEKRTDAFPFYIVFSI